MSSKKKQKERRERQEQLLHEFDHQEQDHYEERKVGSDWLIKSWNGSVNRWQVGVYSEQSYRRYKEYSDNASEFIYKINKE